MSLKHLHRYVDEFAGRHNIRDMDTLAQMQHGRGGHGRTAAALPEADRRLTDGRRWRARGNPFMLVIGRGRHLRRKTQMESRDSQDIRRDFQGTADATQHVAPYPVIVVVGQWLREQWYITASVALEVSNGDLATWSDDGTDGPQLDPHTAIKPFDQVPQPRGLRERDTLSPVTLPATPRGCKPDPGGGRTRDLGTRKPRGGRGVMVPCCFRSHKSQ